MFKNRILFDSDITLTNEYVGFGTDTPLDRLHVVGTVKGIDFKIDGESTFTSYGGFIYEKQLIDADFNLEYIDTHTTLSSDVVTEEDKVFEVDDGAILEISTLDNLNVDNHLGFPNGGTASRNQQPVEGMVRFNDDLNTLEFYNGIEWRQFTVSGASGRGVFGGGTIDTPTPGESRRMDYINIMTLGNSISFGDLTGTARRQSTGCSSSTRGLFMGGQGPTANISDIDYITIASEGNSQDFGDLQSAKQTAGGLSSSTRGISYGCGDVASNVIDYVEIATLGNALDFGDAKTARRDCGTFASSTRGINGGGISDPAILSEIEFITIASKGNGTSFGDLTKSRRSVGGCSNSTRGVFFGGGPIRVNTIDYITITSTGNAIYFGDLTSNRGGGNSGSTSTQIRGIFAGGDTPTKVNTIDYITITSTGNAQDFGDLSANYWIQSGGLSDSHGGLGGF